MGVDIFFYNRIKLFCLNKVHSLIKKRARIQLSEKLECPCFAFEYPCNLMVFINL